MIQKRLNYNSSNSKFLKNSKPSSIQTKTKEGNAKGKKQGF